MMKGHKERLWKGREPKMKGPKDNTQEILRNLGLDDEVRGDFFSS